MLEKEGLDSTLTAAPIHSCANPPSFQYAISPPASPWPALCIDESFNGRAIYAGVWTHNPQDVFIHQSRQYPKDPPTSHSAIDNLLAELSSGRDYSFLDFEWGEYEKLSKGFKGPERYQIYVRIMESLVRGTPFQPPLTILFDGDIFYRATQGDAYLDKARDMLSERLSLPKDALVIHSGGDLDRRVKGVNLANNLAYWLAHRKTRNLRQDPKSKPLPQCL